MQRLDEQTRRDGQRRPQLVLLVGELGLETDGPGRRVDLVVDQRQRAFVELGLAVGRVGDDRQRPGTFSASLMRGSCSSGAVKMTAMGSICAIEATPVEIAGVHDVALVDERKPMRPAIGALMVV